ncbi:radical SAM superfamily enzyme YgiQ (UPF0313 family) [Mobilisporobacter senegalensis]|uniref:Radical SAM superfamily enzyme YgiQ (UPF0313 family) n=1 Tax=Mobilisporobacter senegalensis TaxID=1329262 RepID=A0A3N1X574_9FIRM|nr:B12-binding domain-containing radical SAM protein [Mobilisporobacter senegalensis]ROR21925.1 radical SAM superfamily enzyme YgiQ (UPF0313 family) [Mobilisporobacter senegalensis]
MKILLTAVNAKYIHSNLAIRYLYTNAKKYKDNIELAEYTINNYTDQILQDIYKKKPDIITFSCYIWNMGIIDILTQELRKVMPNTKIWLGGPEVTYDADLKLKENDSIDGIIIGEGEETFLELLDYYIEDSIQLSKIRGIAFKPSAYKFNDEVLSPKAAKDNKDIIVTSFRASMDLSKVPFPYENMEDFKNKLVYYETSRGCPYTCSYCLSSIDMKVRLRDIELVKKELQIFLTNKVPQVKFVDRTFNCNKKHALAIWQFIKEHDNGITNFHFEIAADILDEEELNLLSTLRKGLVQLEIGVQSTNPDTIKAIRRKMDFDKLSKIVLRIKEGQNIHQHLDLIAGLPYEDYTSFRNSFNDVYFLRPDQFQLGFLKVLKGSAIYLENNINNIVYKSEPPYEVLYTPWLSYDDVLNLKTVEEMVEIYYNSGQFTNSILYLENFHDTPFDMYKSLGEYYDEQHLNERSHTRISRYELLLEYFNNLLQKGKTNDGKEEEDAFKELLIYDLYLRENLKSRPSFARDNSPYKSKFREFYSDQEKMGSLLKDYDDYDNKQISRMTHIEYFTIDIDATIKNKKVISKENFILFDYKNRNALNYEANHFLL